MNPSLHSIFAGGSARVAERVNETLIQMTGIDQQGLIQEIFFGFNGGRNCRIRMTDAMNAYRPLK